MNDTPINRSNGVLPILMSLGVLIIGARALIRLGLHAPRHDET